MASVLASVILRGCRSKRSLVPANDSFDDLAGFDFGLLGRDEAARIQRIISGLPRNEAVRRAVLRRSG